MSKKNEVLKRINEVEMLNIEINNLKTKWIEYYFGWVAPFLIIDVTKKDFINLADKCNEFYMHDATLLSGRIGDKDKACIYIHTKVDAQLYTKFIVKN